MNLQSFPAMLSLRDMIMLDKPCCVKIKRIKNDNKYSAFKKSHAHKQETGSRSWGSTSQHNLHKVKYDCHHNVHFHFTSRRIRADTSERFQGLRLKVMLRFDLPAFQTSEPPSVLITELYMYTCRLAQVTPAYWTCGVVFIQRSHVKASSCHVITAARLHIWLICTVHRIFFHTYSKVIKV